MNITTKLVLAAAAVCTFTLANPTPAQAWYGRHYYPVRHYWHGRWYGPGYYGPRLFVGAPFYWGGPRVSIGFGGPYYHPYWHRRYYWHRWHRW